MTKNFARCLPALVLALALPMAAHAADSNPAATKQAATASAHAGMALVAADLKMTQVHLQHVVNCLVGPAGAGFDAQAGNPCKDQGQGAIVDAKGDAATEARLTAALAHARHGLQDATLESAHTDAQQAMTSLQTK
jgi:hypothetical protein